MFHGNKPLRYRDVIHQQPQGSGNIEIAENDRKVGGEVGGLCCNDACYAEEQLVDREIEVDHDEGMMEPR